MHEYGAGFSPATIRDALSVPLRQAFALYAAVRARYGHKGFSYRDADLIRALSAAKDKEGAA